MLSYNQDTQEIARPTEMLARIESYMTSLRTLELYVNIDMTRVLTAVLLQETQPLDSKGESTIASAYTGWWIMLTYLLFAFIHNLNFFDQNESTFVLITMDSVLEYTLYEYLLIKVRCYFVRSF